MLPAVFVAYALVTKDAAHLYTDPVKVNDGVKDHLEGAGVTVKPYAAMLGDVKSQAAAGAKIALDPSKVSYALFQAAAESAGGGGAKGGARKRDARGTKKAASAAPATAAGSEWLIGLGGRGEIGGWAVGEGCTQGHVGVPVAAACFLLDTSTHTLAPTRTLTLVPSLITQHTRTHPLPPLPHTTTQPHPTHHHPTTPPPPGDAVVELASPIIAAKALKNGAELAGMREAHLRDAVAVCDFLAWMEAQVGEGDEGGDWAWGV